ncbi:hypothetical protein [Pseudomonas sp. Irchel 3E13]|uniref:gp53-like domain-containing protein n=1 Tax=Pseudomonas sp. Irchel 3E13 TaxID=2008975 RepID=UPI000BA49C9A|nr:hypothetical protein [Pseudomonas sp. Irchel 3E13]
MDYPKSTPGVGLVNGKFADENPTTGQIGSLIPSAWGNAVTDEILGVIRAADLVPDENDRTQLARAIAAIIGAPSGVPAGTYNKVKVNARGLVIEGSNPTTLDGHGITDGLQKGFRGLGGTTAPIGTVDVIGLEGGFYSFGAGASGFGQYCTVLNFPYSTANYAAQLAFAFSGEEPVILARMAKSAGAWGYTRTLWHSGNFNPTLYATKATTLVGYGIVDAYTKSYIDGELAKKANWAITLGGYGITDAFTKTEVTALLANKLSVGGVSQQVPVLAAGTTGTTYSSSAMQIREAREVGDAQSGDDYAPAIGLHWLGRATGRLIMDALGTLKWNGQPLLLGLRASQEEVNGGGGGDNNVVTVSKMRLGFNVIKGGGGANNAVVFPTWLGGLVVQWGVHVANTADAETAVTFPLGFNIIPACVSMLTHDGTLTQSGVVSQGRGLTATGFQSRREDIGTAYSFSATAYIRWIAIGY